MKSDSPQTTWLTKIPLWAYPTALVVLIWGLSYLPGGNDLKLLIVPVLGWSLTIWLFRKYKAVRLFVLISFLFIVFGLIFIATLSSGMNDMINN
jgi:hypothetical protein